jgi:hypothetical protein
VTSETLAGTSAKSRNEQLVQNLPAAKTRAYPMGVSGRDTPMQQASKTRKPTVEKGLEKMGSIQQRRHCPDALHRNKKRQGANEAGTGYRQHPRNVSPNWQKPQLRTSRGQGLRLIPLLISPGALGDHKHTKRH